MFQRTAHYVFPRFQEWLCNLIGFPQSWTGPDKFETYNKACILKLSKISFEFGLLDWFGDGLCTLTVNGDFLFYLDNSKESKNIF